jgi:hypothetical protein
METSRMFQDGMSPTTKIYSKANVDIGSESTTEEEIDEADSMEPCHSPLTKSVSSMVRKKKKSTEPSTQKSKVDSTQTTAVLNADSSGKASTKRYFAPKYQQTSVNAAAVALTWLQEKVFCSHFEEL